AFTAGQNGSFTVTATGTPTPSLSETGALPAGVTLTDNGNGTATLGGTPALVSTATDYHFTITATSPAGTANQSFTLTVNPVTSSSVQNTVQNAPANSTVTYTVDPAQPDAAATLLNAVNTLPSQSGHPVTVELDLGNTSLGDLTASPPPGVTLVIQGNG